MKRAVWDARARWVMGGNTVWKYATSTDWLDSAVHGKAPAEGAVTGSVDQGAVSEGKTLLVEANVPCMADLVLGGDVDDVVSRTFTMAIANEDTSNACSLNVLHLHTVGCRQDMDEASPDAEMPAVLRLAGERVPRG